MHKGPAGSAPKAQVAFRVGHRISGCCPVEQEIELLRRIITDDRETPGLSVTELQAVRFWGVDADHCRALLQALVAPRSAARPLESDDASAARPRNGREAAVTTHTPQREPLGLVW